MGRMDLRWYTYAGGTVIWFTMLNRKLNRTLVPGYNDTSFLDRDTCDQVMRGADFQHEHLYLPRQPSNTEVVSVSQRNLKYGLEMPLDSERTRNHKQSLF